MAKRRNYNPLIRQLPRFGGSGRINNPKLFRGINFWSHRKMSDVGIAAAGMFTGQSPLGLLIANMLLNRHRDTEATPEEENLPEVEQQPGPLGQTPDLIPKGVEAVSTPIPKKESGVVKVLNKHTELLEGIKKLLDRQFGPKSEIETDEELASKRRNEFGGPKLYDARGNQIDLGPEKKKEKEVKKETPIIKTVEEVAEAAGMLKAFNWVKSALGWTSKAATVAGTVETGVVATSTVAKGAKGIATAAKGATAIGKGASTIAKISEVTGIGGRVLSGLRFIKALGPITTAVSLMVDAWEADKNTAKWRNIKESEVTKSIKTQTTNASIIARWLGMPADFLSVLTNKKSTAATFGSENLRKVIIGLSEQFKSKTSGFMNTPITEMFKQSQTQQLPTLNKPPIDQAATNIPVSPGTTPATPKQDKLGIDKAENQIWLKEFVSSGNPVMDKLMKGIAIVEKSPSGINNPGNIRPINNYTFPGQTGIDKSKDKIGYVIFDKKTSGWKALAHQLQEGHNAGMKNPEIQNTLDLFRKYAPQEDRNDPEAYAETIKKLTGIDPKQPIRPLLQKDTDSGIIPSPQMQTPDLSKGVGITSASMENSLTKSTASSKPVVIVTPTPKVQSSNSGSGMLLPSNPKNSEDTYDAVNKSSWRPT